LLRRAGTQVRSRRVASPRRNASPLAACCLAAPERKYARDHDETSRRVA
jgi:hypothetical protein